MSALSVDWAPLLPWPVLAGLTSLALVLVGFAFYRRAGGTFLRFLSFAVLLTALANPSLVEELRDPVDDIVYLVVDESLSQGIGQRQAQTQAALDHLQEALANQPNTEVEIVRGGRDRPGAQQDGTELFAELQQAMSKVARHRVAGILVISDGQVHDVPEAFESLGIDAPLHHILTGQEDEGDRRLQIVQAPKFGIVGRELSLVLRVDDMPARQSGSPAQVTIRQDGGEARQIELPVGTEQSIDFTLDHRGPTILEIGVDDGPEELSRLNNQAAVAVNGVRDRLRVLLVSGEPHAGERAWRNILKSDPSVDLVHFTILRPPEKQDGTPIRELSLIAFPTRELFEVKLDEFDLIIFDRYRRRGVLPSMYLDNIARYVEKGGALFEAVGPAFATPLSLYRTPLGRVLPGEPTGHIFERGYHPQVSDLGHRHPVTANLTIPGGATEKDEPPWGRWFRHVEAEPRRGTILMNGIEESPLLILDRFGKGRVAQLMSDHMWLWSRGYEGGGPQAELLRRIAHWLMKEPDLEEEDLRARTVAGRLMIERRSLDEDLPKVEVRTPSGKNEGITLEAESGGRASGSLAIEEPGLYRISDGARTTLAAAGPLNPLEFDDIRSSAEKLDPLVRASGGATVRVSDGKLPSLRKVRPDRDRSGRGWLGIAASGSYVVTGITQISLLPVWLLLAVLLATILLAWQREGR